MCIRGFILTVGLVAARCLAADSNNASHVVRPVIHAKNEQKVAAMRAASLIVIAEVRAIEISSKSRGVEKPPGVGGPHTPSIPLHLAKISAKRLLNIRGTANEMVEFYSWIWASGKHGGPRLFRAKPESIHILFLTQHSGYLHTVGDYPAYDLEVPARYVHRFIENWKSGYSRGAGLLERIAAVMLKAELESLDGTEDAKLSFTSELETLTGEHFAVTQLGILCRTLKNPVGRAKACSQYSLSARQ